MAGEARDIKVQIKGVDVLRHGESIVQKAQRGSLRFPPGNLIQRRLHFRKRTVETPCHLRLSRKPKSRRRVPVAFQRFPLIALYHNFRAGIGTCGNMPIQISSKLLYLTAILLPRPFFRFFLRLGAFCLSPDTVSAGSLSRIGSFPSVFACPSRRRAAGREQ